MPGSVSKIESKKDKNAKKAKEERRKALGISTPDRSTECSVEKSELEGSQLETPQRKLSHLQPSITEMLVSEKKEEHAADQISTTEIKAMFLTLENKIGKLSSSIVTREYLDSEIRKLISEKFMKDILRELEENLKSLIKKEIDVFKREISELKKNVTVLQEYVEKLNHVTGGMQIVLDNMKKDNEKLKKENNTLTEKVTQLSQENKHNGFLINSLDQYSRRSSVRIYGADDRNKEENPHQTTERLVQLFKEKLDLRICERDIDISHRIGKFTEAGNRPIICKFVSRIVKSEVVKARRKLKGTPVVIKEDLTVKNAKLLQNVTERQNVKSAWSDEGRIIALLQSGKRVVVDLATDLTAL